MIFGTLNHYTIHPNGCIQFDMKIHCCRFTEHSDQALVLHYNGIVVYVLWIYLLKETIWCVPYHIIGVEAARVSHLDRVLNYALTTGF